MTDLNPEGLEKAAEEVADEMPSCAVCEDRDTRRCQYCRREAERYARAAVTAYLGHTEVTTVEGLPVGTLIQMKGIPAPFLLTPYGWESTRFYGKPVYDYIADPERYPATVLHRGAP